MLKYMRERARFFLSDDSGAVIIEFAFTFLPVTIALIGVFETSWMMMVQNDMSRAASEVARSIRMNNITGSDALNGNRWTHDELKANYCGRLWVVSCGSANMTFELHQLKNIGQAASVTSSLNTTGDWTVTTQCCEFGNPANNSGDPGSVVLMRIYGEFPGLARFWNPAIAHTKEGKTILAVTQLFTNEPE